MRTELDLVLRVGGVCGEDGVIVGVGGTEAKIHRRVHERRVEGHRERRRGASSGAEVSGIAAVVGVLSCELRAGQEGLPDRTVCDDGGQVRLIEEVPAIGAAVVARQVHTGPGGVDGTGENVLVELVVCHEPAAIAELDAGDGMVS